MKFNNENEFARAWNILKDIGLPITDSPPGNAHTPRLTPKPPSSISPVPTIFSPASVTSSRTIETPIQLQSSIQEPLRACSSSAHPPFSTPCLSDFVIPPRPETSAADNRQSKPYSTNGRISGPASSMLARTSSFPSTLSFPEAMTQLPSFYVAQLEREVSTPRKMRRVFYNKN